MGTERLHVGQGRETPARNVQLTNEKVVSMCFFFSVEQKLPLKQTIFFISIGNN